MSEPHDSLEPPSSSGALVPAEAPFGASALRTFPRPLAGFVTQLLACERRLAPYRARRRAEADEATGRYDAAEVRTPRPPARFDKVL